MIEFCEEVGGVIKNGSTKGDWEGKMTERGNEGGRVGFRSSN